VSLERAESISHAFEDMDKESLSLRVSNGKLILRLALVVLLRNSIINGVKLGSKELHHNEESKIRTKTDCSHVQCDEVVSIADLVQGDSKQVL
jgi:hypothetical protein